MLGVLAFLTVGVRLGDSEFGDRRAPDNDISQLSFQTLLLHQILRVGRTAGLLLFVAPLPLSRLADWGYPRRLWSPVIMHGQRLSFGIDITLSGIPS